MRAVDLFAGWGGFTLGAERADVDVVWAANHWELAVEAHALNHPDTLHVCQDLRQADWTLLPNYELLLASPACQGHSSASQPKRRAYHDAIRATAWAIVDCADVTDPTAIVVENVIDFKRWRLYPVWRAALETMGYNLQELVITASEHGVPQRRKRLFVVGTKTDSNLVLRPTAEPAFGPCIDWDDGKWRPIRSTTPKARERMRNGRKAHGDRFLSQHVTNHPGVGLDEPIRTITTKDQWVAVNGDQYRPLTIREYARGMGFPEGYTWPDHSTRTEQVKGLGNAVCPPVATSVITALKEAA